MTIVQAIVLALFTAAAAVLPVSGGAHWKIAEKLLGLNAADPSVQAYKAAVYFGVLISFLIVYRRQLIALLREALVLLGLSRPSRRTRGIPFERRELIFLLFAMIPLFFALIVRKTLFTLDQSDNALAYIAVLLALSGTILFFSDRGVRSRRDLTHMTLQDGIIMSAAQTFSVFPGLSRSALTLSAGMSLGLERCAALEFSGLLAVPAYFGAGIVQILQAKTLGDSILNPWMFLLGIMLAALTGSVVLTLFCRLAKHRRTSVFSYWSWGTGIFALILFLMSA